MSDAAAFYTGLVADAYAELKSTSFGADRYERFVRDHGEPALEVGCGDGHPLLALRAAGLDVAGLDSSADMLARCRRNAEQQGLEVELYHQTMQDMDLGRRFASIYLAGPSFNLLPDDETGARALRALADHLADDGAALVPLWVPPPTPHADLGRVRETVDDAGATLRCTTMSEVYDAEARDRITTLRYERVSVTGDTEVLDRQWHIHWWTPEGFRQLCTTTGVRLVSFEIGADPADLTAVIAR